MRMFITTRVKQHYVILFKADSCQIFIKIPFLFYKETRVFKHIWLPKGNSGEKKYRSRLLHKRVLLYADINSMAMF